MKYNEEHLTIYIYDVYTICNNKSKGKDVSVLN